MMMNMMMNMMNMMMIAFIERFEDKWYWRSLSQKARVACMQRSEIRD